MRWEDNATGNVHQQSLVPVSDPARHRSDTDTDGLPSGHFQVFKATLALHYLLLATLVTALVQDPGLCLSGGIFLGLSDIIILSFKCLPAHGLSYHVVTIFYILQNLKSCHTKSQSTKLILSFYQL